MKDEDKTEGRIEGKRDRTIEIAKNMLKENFEISMISKITNLTEEEITALEEE